MPDPKRLSQSAQIANDFVHIKLDDQTDRLDLTVKAPNAQGELVPILERIGQANEQYPLCFEWIREGESECWTDANAIALAIHHTFDQGSYHLLLRLQNDSPWLHVQESLAANDQAAGLHTERFEAIWAFQNWQEPGEVFSPHLVPESRDVIGRHVLRSPALTAQCADRAAALVGDLASIQKIQPLPVAMNLLRREHTPLFYSGLRPHRVRDHVYFEYETRSIRAAILQHSYYLWVSAQAAPGEALGQSRKKLWAGFGATNLKGWSAGPLSGEEYARQIFPAILNERWAETTIGQNRVGAIRLHRSYPEDVWFCAWFNSLRTSYGLYLWGQFLQNRDWMDKALMTRNLVLSAPQNQGLFPTLFVFCEKPRWQHSHHQGGGPGIYHLFDMSWTTYHLLRWHRDIQPDSNSIDFAKRYAQGIMALSQMDGALPAFVDAVTFAPVQQVNHQALLKDLAAHPGGDSYIPFMLQHHWTQERFVSGAEDSATLLCLAELACLLTLDDPDRKKILTCAKQIAGYLELEIFPEAKWMDFEVYYSCSPKSLLFYDHRSGQWPQNTLCLHMAAAGLLRLYEATQEQHFLQLAWQALNRLCLYQQVWDPAFLNFNGFGGYGVMNTDGEWNDARQAQFADTHLDFYRLTGDREQQQRAQAACRAAFTTTFLPANSTVYPTGWWRRPRGQAAENHGHSGFDRFCGVSGFDWGSGSALATAAYFQLHGIDW